MTHRAVFIAGTDTGIGKTHAACALIHALRNAGLGVAGMKPVASGCDDTAAGLRNEDALALQQASSPPVMDYSTINPVAMREPLSPHLAAQRDGVTIALPPMRAAFEQLLDSQDRVVVEGVGGWMVPLAPGLDASEIARAWRLPVILVVGLRLGCLSHARLTARAIVDDGCELLGWIGNRIDPQMAAVEENLATLDNLLPAPCLGVLEHGPAAAQAAALLTRAAARLA